jgi:hypothetical protein
LNREQRILLWAGFLLAFATWLNVRPDSFIQLINYFVPVSLDPIIFEYTGASLTLIGSFLVVSDWNVWSGKSKDKTTRTFWGMFLMFESAGYLMISSALDIYPIFNFPNLPSASLRVGVAFLLVIGSLLVAYSTLSAIGEIRRIVGKLQKTMNSADEGASQSARP